MQQTLTRPLDARPATAIAAAAAGGLATGLCAGRLLAEETAAAWAWQPLPIAALAVLFALAGAAAALAAHRPSRRPAVRDLIAPACAFLLPALYLAQPHANPLQARVLLGGAVAAAALLATATVRSEAGPSAGRRAARLVSVGLLLMPLLIYLATLSPTLGEADSFEFQVTASRLGVAHPTGYPLYILLGRLFIFLPIGDVAYRVNLLSPVSAALSVALTYLITMRLTGRRAPALVAALAFALSRTFWSQAVIAEVYCLNAAFVALLLYLLVSPSGAPSWRRLQAAALVYGLSLTNHLTMVLLAPALAISALWHGLGLARQWRRLLGAAGLFGLGLSVYLYLPLRWPALNGGRRLGAREFLGWITGQRFSVSLHLDTWLRDPMRYRILGRLVLEQYGWVGAALAVAGLAWLLRRQRRTGVCLLVAWAAYALYALNYVVSDISVFLIPAHLIMAICIGAALAALAGWFEAKAGLLAALLILAAALLPLSLAWGNWPLVDRSQTGREELRWGRRVLALDIPPRAAILADSEKIAPLYYLWSVEGVRPDLDVVVMGDEAGYRQQVEARTAAGQPVYLARFVPGLEGRFHLRSLGPLVEVSPAPLATPPPIAHPLAARLGDQVRLLGFEAGDLSVEPGDALWLTLYWQPEAAVPGHYQVRLRLVGPSGHVWWEASAHPVNGLYPTPAWRPGEVIPDHHQVPIDRYLPPGSYRLEVGLFPPFGTQGLPIAGAGSDLLALGDVQVRQGTPASASLAALPGPRRSSFGDLLLVGSDLLSTVRPGGRLPIALYWRPLRPCQDYEIVVEALDQAGQVVASAAGQPLYGEYPVSRWPPGQTVRTTHLLTAPLSAGPLRLQVGLRDAASGRPVAVQAGWLRAAAARCPLGSTMVQGAPLAGAGVTNFGDSIYLLGHELGSRTLHPGDALDLGLTWQCAGKMAQDYTVFIHFLDAGDQVRGQVDAWPLQGTYPTSQWAEGETIHDSYSVRLDPGAPPGPYRLEIGWYLLSTMERLPVLDQDLRPIDDRVIIDGLQAVAPGS